MIVMFDGKKYARIREYPQLQPYVEPKTTYLLLDEQSRCSDLPLKPIDKVETANGSRTELKWPDEITNQKDGVTVTDHGVIMKF